MKGIAGLSALLLLASAVHAQEPPEFRRVVTGFSEDGRAVVVSDGPPAQIIAFDALPGYLLAPMWETGPEPEIDRSGQAPVYTPGSLIPPPGGTRLLLFRWPSQAEMTAAAENPSMMEELAAQLTLQAPDLVASTSKHNPALHATPSIDYVIVLSGTVAMELDDGAMVTLNPGDVVVQNGTPHAWHSVGDEGAVLAAVLVGAPPPETP